MCDCCTRWSTRAAGPCTKGCKDATSQGARRKPDMATARTSGKARLTSSGSEQRPADKEGGCSVNLGSQAPVTRNYQQPAQCIFVVRTRKCPPLRIMSIIRSCSEARQCLEERCKQKTEWSALGSSIVSHFLNVEAAFATTKRSERIKRHEHGRHPVRQLEGDAAVHSPQWLRDFGCSGTHTPAAFISGVPLKFIWHIFINLGCINKCRPEVGSEGNIDGIPSSECIRSFRVLHSSAHRQNFWKLQKSKVPEDMGDAVCIVTQLLASLLSDVEVLDRQSVHSI